MFRFSKTVLIFVATLIYCMIGWYASLSIGDWPSLMFLDDWPSLVAPFLLLGVPAWLASKRVRDKRELRIFQLTASSLLAVSVLIWYVSSTTRSFIRFPNWGVSLENGGFQIFWYGPLFPLKIENLFSMWPPSWVPRFEPSEIFPRKIGRLTTPQFDLHFPLWIPVITFLMPTIILFKRKPRSLPGRCDTCGYNLTGNTSGKCPECGTQLQQIVIPIIEATGAAQQRSSK
jgi:hypothetical protein